MIGILYVMDSLRPDFLSCYGYKKETSPNIDKIAEEGVIFNNAFAQSTWTRPSGASMLSSTYPSVHRVITVEDFFSPGIPALPEQLKKKFKTIAISALGNISPDFGFGRGFDHFIELYKEKAVLEKRGKVETERVGWQHHFKADSIAVATSEDINEFLFPLLEKYTEKDLFIFIWSLDTHDPYFHRNPEIAKFCSPSEEILWWNDIVKMESEEERNRLKILYEDMIYYNDYHIGALTEKLKKLDLYDQTFFIITSDHGESFGEHGFNSHAGLPYDEQIRVPLLMKFPNSEFHGQVEDLVQHIDLHPTILTYYNIENKGSAQGKNLIPLISKKEKINDFVFNETQFNKNSPRYTSIRTNDHKYIEIKFPKLRAAKSLKRTLGNLRNYIKNLFADSQMLFSLKDDTEEKNNAIKKEKHVLNELKSKMELILDNNQKKSILITEYQKKQEIDEKIKKQLKALGYLE